MLRLCPLGPTWILRWASSFLDYFKKYIRELKLVSKCLNVVPRNKWQHNKAYQSLITLCLIESSLRSFSLVASTMCGKFKSILKNGTPKCTTRTTIIVFHWSCNLTKPSWYIDIRLYGLNIDNEKFHHMNLTYTFIVCNYFDIIRMCNLN